MLVRGNTINEEMETFANDPIMAVESTTALCITDSEPPTNGIQNPTTLNDYRQPDAMTAYAAPRGDSPPRKLFALLKPPIDEYMPDRKLPFLKSNIPRPASSSIQIRFPSSVIIDKSETSAQQQIVALNSGAIAPSAQNYSNTTMLSTAGVTKPRTITISTSKPNEPMQHPQSVSNVQLPNSGFLDLASLQTSVSSTQVPSNINNTWFDTLKGMPRNGRQLPTINNSYSNKIAPTNIYSPNDFSKPTIITIPTISKEDLPIPPDPNIYSLSNVPTLPRTINKRSATVPATTFTYSYLKLLSIYVREAKGYTASNCSGSRDPLATDPNIKADNIFLHLLSKDKPLKKIEPVYLVEDDEEANDFVEGAETDASNEELVEQSDSERCESNRNLSLRCNDENEDNSTSDAEDLTEDIESDANMIMKLVDSNDNADIRDKYTQTSDLGPSSMQLFDKIAELKGKLLQQTNEIVSLRAAMRLIKSRNGTNGIQI